MRRALFFACRGRWLSATAQDMHRGPAACGLRPELVVLTSIWNGQGEKEKQSRIRRRQGRASSAGREAGARAKPSGGNSEAFESSSSAAAAERGAARTSKNMKSVIIKTKIEMEATDHIFQ